FRLPPRDGIASQVEDFLQVVSEPPRPGAMDIPSRTTLYDLLIAPAERFLKTKTNLIIIPDGILHYLPFEALVSHSDDGDPLYLIVRFTVRYSPSVTTLGFLQERKEEREPTHMSQLIAFGNPEFGGAIAPLEDGDISERGLYEFCGYGFSPLPYTEEEVNAIAAVFPNGSTARFLGTEAKEETVKTQDLAGFRKVHFATHAVIDEEFPSRSCVVLTLDDDPAEDGFLQLNEIFNLKLHADLVVLSACRTGLGRLVEGEGVIGLSRGFFYAGANSLLLTLWGVNDRSTATFMENFYRQMRKGNSKADALRDAKLSFIKGDLPSLRHPYYWAPFVLIGVN
ncbi:MAG: CHAT domain-containing protein, partial [Desulfobacteraceae bacterium]|nr:CHAT domain-containing protein [Desulfobacteraceae bacterium]